MDCPTNISETVDPVALYWKGYKVKGYKETDEILAYMLLVQNSSPSATAQQADSRHNTVSEDNEPRAVTFHFRPHQR